jgi:hypothetical protein
MSTSSSSSPAEARAALAAALAKEIARPVPPAVVAMAEAIRARHPAAAQAVLFYGSGLRLGEASDGSEGLLDFYLVVDRYRRAYRSLGLALTNRLLPPNVFYLELPYEGRRLRAKYAVIAADQLQRRLRPGFPEPSLWARFCQPTRLVLTRDGETAKAIVAMLADAVQAFAVAALPLVGMRFKAREVWLAGLEATYGAEMRAEGAGRPDALYRADQARNDQILEHALHALGAVEGPRDTSDAWLRNKPFASGGWRWHGRRWLGRLLHLLRLIKGTFTFEGGVDYILWKIERHTGRRPRMSDWERRHPVLAAPLLLVRFYREGAFR